MLIVDADAQSPVPQLCEERLPVLGAQDRGIKGQGYLINALVSQTLDVIHYLVNRRDDDPVPSSEDLVRLFSSPAEGAVKGAPPPYAEPVPARVGHRQG